MRPWPDQGRKWTAIYVLWTDLDHVSHSSGVMVSVLISSAVDRGFEPSVGGRIKQKTIHFVFVASPLNMQHQGESKDGLARNQNNVSE